MKTIESFKINHNKLKKGMYVSRIDDDVITYDIRMKLPNNSENDYLTTAIAHTIEHLFATYARNSEFGKYVIYVGPMGCRTGFYFLVKDKMSKNDVLKIVKNSMEFIKNYEGEIPGSTREECGNYLDHDLTGAKIVAEDMLEILKNWNEEKMHYEQ